MDLAPKDGTEVIASDGTRWHKVAWLDNRTSKLASPDYSWSVPDSWQDEQGGYFTPDGLIGWMPGPLVVSPAPAQAVTGPQRLEIALQALGYRNDCDNHFRLELLTAVRKFTVMTGDLALEGACDERLATLPVSGRRG